MNIFNSICNFKIKACIFGTVLAVLSGIPHSYATQMVPQQTQQTIQNLCQKIKPNTQGEIKVSVKLIYAFLSAQAANGFAGISWDHSDLHFAKNPGDAAKKAKNAFDWKKTKTIHTVMLHESADPVPPTSPKHLAERDLLLRIIDHDKNKKGTCHFTVEDHEYKGSMEAYLPSTDPAYANYFFYTKSGYQIRSGQAICPDLKFKIVFKIRFNPPLQKNKPFTGFAFTLTTLFPRHDTPLTTAIPGIWTNEQLNDTKNRETLFCMALQSHLGKIPAMAGYLRWFNIDSISLLKTAAWNELKRSVNVSTKDQLKEILSELPQETQLEPSAKEQLKEILSDLIRETQPELSTTDKPALPTTKTTPETTPTE